MDGVLSSFFLMCDNVRFTHSEFLRMMILSTAMIQSLVKSHECDQTATSGAPSLVQGLTSITQQQLTGSGAKEFGP